MKTEKIALYSMALAIGAMAFSSCKEKKQDEDIIVEKIIEKPKDSATAMSSDRKSGEAKWINDNKYTYIIEATTSFLSWSITTCHTTTTASRSP